MSENMIVTLIAVGGTVLGTIVGAIGTFLVQRYDRNRSSEENRRLRIDNHRESLYFEVVQILNVMIYETNVEKMNVCLTQLNDLRGTVYLRASKKVRNAFDEAESAGQSLMRSTRDEDQYEAQNSRILIEKLVLLTHLIRKELGYEMD